MNRSTNNRRLINIINIIIIIIMLGSLVSSEINIKETFAKSMTSSNSIRECLKNNKQRNCTIRWNKDNKTKVGFFNFVKAVTRWN